MTTESVRVKSVKGRPEGLKLLLLAGLSVQAWGVLVGLSLIVLNIAGLQAL